MPDRALERDRRPRRRAAPGRCRTGSAGGSRGRTRRERPESTARRRARLNSPAPGRPSWPRLSPPRTITGRSGAAAAGKPGDDRHRLGQAVTDADDRESIGRRQHVLAEQGCVRAADDRHQPCLPCRHGQPGAFGEVIDVQAERGCPGPALQRGMVGAERQVREQRFHAAGSAGAWPASSVRGSGRTHPAAWTGGAAPRAQTAGSHWAPRGLDRDRTIASHQDGDVLGYRCRRAGDVTGALQQPFQCRGPPGVRGRVIQRWHIRAEPAAGQPGRAPARGCSAPRSRTGSVGGQECPRAHRPDPGTRNRRAQRLSSGSRRARQPP